jgi:hypothetical protein
MIGTVETRVGNFRQGGEVPKLGKAKEEDRKLYLDTLQKMGRWRLRSKTRVGYAPQIHLPACRKTAFV